ncbi:MAG: hypothetical protein SWH68_09010 [Thermodesulfobacteriota bacterium]|nr:hypothetical protein [Thermodesulfobacteriota bacterium]
MQEGEHYADEIELIDVFRVLWKRKYLIIGIVVCVAFVVPVALWMIFPCHRVVKSSIALNFKGIEEHKNPDGSVFKQEQIIAPAVLDKAFDKLKTKTDEAVDEHRSKILNNVNITPVIPENIEQKIVNAEEKGVVYTYYPNQFIIAHKAKTVGGVLDRQAQVLLLDNIINVYADFFQQEYLEVPFVNMDFPDNFLENNDYMDIVASFEQTIERMLALAAPRIDQPGLYKMSVEDYTFSRLQSELELLKNTSLSKASAIIKHLQISKDAEALITTYKYKIAQLEMQKEKFTRKAQVSHELLTEMNRPAVSNLPQGLGMSPSETDANFLVDASFIERLKKNDSVDYLLKTYMEAKGKANDADVNIAALQEKMTALKEDTGHKVSPANIAYVQSALKDIKEKIIMYAGIANELNIKFLTQRNENAVRTISQPQVEFTRGVNIQITSLLAVFCSMFLAIFAAFLVEYISNAREQDASNVPGLNQQHDDANLTDVELFSQKSGRPASKS